MEKVPSFRVSVAPMMDWTDRHFRFFIRLITKKSLLYTEMVTTGAILKSTSNHRYLQFSVEELPLSLQLGGDSPRDLAECAKIGEEYGYSEINLNVGCPSDRVQSGSFGACLMKEPHLVAEMVAACKAKVKIPVTVKHRIGVNGKENYEDLVNFVDLIQKAGVDGISVHARIAILEGLSPKENRTVPPIRYNDVYKLKSHFPSLPISINGQIKSIGEMKEHLQFVDGVMIGRAAYENPFLFQKVDCDFFGENEQSVTREEVIEKLQPYYERELSLGTKPHHILRHCFGLYHGVKGAGQYRKFLTSFMFDLDKSKTILKDFLKISADPILF